MKSSLTKDLVPHFGGENLTGKANEKSIEFLGVKTNSNPIERNYLWFLRSDTEENLSKIVPLMLKRIMFSHFIMKHSNDFFS